MSTIWSSRKPGEQKSATVIPLPDDPSGILINPSGVPDWVKDPNGCKVRVRGKLHTEAGRLCAKCGKPIKDGTEVLCADVADRRDRIWFVYECSEGCGFVWEQHDDPAVEAEKNAALADYLA